MQVASRPVLTRVAIVAAALTALLCLQPEPAQPIEPAGAGTGGAARTLVLSDQARRYLALQYRAYPTEFLGCMIGEFRGRSVVVWRIAPADVDPAHSTPTHVMAEQACEAGLVTDEAAGYETATKEARTGMRRLLTKLERRRHSATD